MLTFRVEYTLVKAYISTKEKERSMIELLYSLMYRYYMEQTWGANARARASQSAGSLEWVSRI